MKKKSTKYGKLYILGNTCGWFIVGLLISYFIGLVPLFHRIEFLQDPISLAALLAIVVGYVGSVLRLVKMTEEVTD